MPCTVERGDAGRADAPTAGRPVGSVRLAEPVPRVVAGFSLVEMLVVVVVIGVVVTAATLAFSGGDRELEQAARRAEIRVRLACERAIATGTDFGFALVEDRLRFGRIVAGRWDPVGAGPSEELRERGLGDGVAVVAFRDGLPLSAVDPTQPQFACFASGELTPFRLELQHPGAALPWRVEGRIDGRLEVARADPR